MFEAWGWNDRWDGLFRAAEPSSTGEPARVTEHHRDRWIIQTRGGPQAARLVKTGGLERMPTTGDWVVAEPGPNPTDPWSIEAVLSSRSSIRRAAAGDVQYEQVLAANIDRVWIVHGLDSAPNLRRIERYLAVAWESGASPEVVLTKSDLCTDLVRARAEVESVSMGVLVWTVSTSDPAAVERIRESLEFGRTVALLGPSGAGKSTLVNALSEAAIAETADVRDGDRKGRHTTTSRQLFQISNGALLLDTPGLRELRVMGLDEGLGHAFPEIETLAGGCRFRDCKHAGEPGCAVLAAVEDGGLSSERLASYRKLEAEAAAEHRRTDPVAKNAAIADYKTSMKTLKYHPKHK